VKRRRVPGLIDLFEVSGPTEIVDLARDSRLDRKFETRTCPVNSFLLKRSLRVLSLAGRRFPTMTARDVFGNINHPTMVLSRKLLLSGLIVLYLHANGRIAVEGFT
jgi:hypothetical protein